MLSRNRFVATAVTVAVAAVLTMSGEAMELWPIFGSANQLLAALALLAVSIWLARRGTGNLFVRIPMYFMFAVTLSSLVTLFYTHALALVRGELSFGHVILAFLSVLLTGVALVLFHESRRSMKIIAKEEVHAPLKV
jgi:carbon starvation protein